MRTGPAILLAGLLGAAVGLAPRASAAEAVLDRVAAVVNDEVVALSEIYEVGSDHILEQCPTTTPVCVEREERYVLDAIVRRLLQRQELQRLGADITAAEVDQTIDNVVAQYEYPDRAALRAEVEGAGFSWAAYRAQQVEEPLREQKFQEVVLRNRIAISDDELMDRYRRMTRDVEAPLVARIEAFGYLVPEGGSDALADAVQTVRRSLQAVRKGKTPFAEVQSTLDTAGVASLFSGVDFAEDDLNPSLAEVVFAATAGDVPEPVLASGVVYGLNVLSLTEGDKDVASFEEAREGLMQQLFRDKMEDASNEWYEQAKRRAAIRYHVGPTDEPEADDADEADEADESGEAGATP